MGEMKTARGSLIEWGVATRALPGEGISGDLHVVKEFPHGVIVAVVDGLGHGEEAAAAAQTAVAHVESHAQESVITLVRQCHEALRSTRGAVMSLAYFNPDDDTMTWIGVGNIDGALFRADPAAQPGHENLMTFGGTVGYVLPSLKAVVVPLSAGDTLIFATDGIRSGFIETFRQNEQPQKAADRILERFVKDNDDALVLVARYRGRAA